MTRALATAAAALLDVSGVEFLAAGMSSTAWTAHGADGDELVIRVPNGDGLRLVPDYRQEARLNAALIAVGVPATATMVVTVDGTDCSVAPRRRGSPVTETGWTDAFVRDIAIALAAAHSLPPQQFGLPTAVDRFWLARIWPFDDLSLDEHPVTATFPGEVQRIRSYAERILSAGADPPVVVHTDLHPQHLLQSPEGRLSALLDFGDAFAGPAAWDFACLRYYHGDEIARRVAGLYPAGAELREATTLLSMAFALYKLDKTPDRPDVVARVRRLLHPI
ncbi:MAG: aminoglycoside phosphotransferase family protein [Acidimicrobiales bacterium]